MPGAPDPLQPGRHARRRLDLHHEVDRAHVDAQLQRRRGDHGGEASGLEILLDGRPLLVRHRPVVRPRQNRRRACGSARLAHQLGRRTPRQPRGRLRSLGPLAPLELDLVEASGEALGEPPGVREHQRRPMGLDQVGDPLLDVRPDRTAPRIARRGPGQIAPDRHVAQRSQVGHRHHDPQVPLLVRRWIHDRHRTPPDQEPRDLLHRTHRRRQPDPLRGRAQQGVQPIERHGEMRPPLGAGDRVDLVHDHRLDAPQRLPRRGRQQQEQRLRRRDQDVGRRPPEPSPLVGRGVARPHGHRDLRTRQAQPRRRMPDPDQR